MSIAGKVTRKGQVTIPADMRLALGIGEGDRVVFRLEDGAVTIAPARTLVSKLSAVAGGRSEPILETSEMHDVIAAGFAEDEESLMEELGIESPVRGRECPPSSDPPGSSRSLTSGGRAA